jgi:hypothetical protein
LTTDGVTHLLARRLVTLRLESAQDGVSFSRGHISDVLAETLLGVGLNRVVDLVRKIL